MINFFVGLFTGLFLIIFEKRWESIAKIEYNVRRLNKKSLIKWLHKFFLLDITQEEAQKLKDESFIGISLAFHGPLLMIILLTIYCSLCIFWAYESISAKPLDQVWLLAIKQVGLLVGICFTFFLMTRLKPYQLFFSNRKICLLIK